MTNPYQHALDTKRIALNNLGLATWVKHNESAIMSALEACSKIQVLNNDGTTNMSVELDRAVAVPTQVFSPVLDFHADEEHF